MDLLQATSVGNPVTQQVKFKKAATRGSRSKLCFFTNVLHTLSTTASARCVRNRKCSSTVGPTNLLLEAPVHEHTPDAAGHVMNSTKRPHEDVCWVQSTDSLVFSASPVAPSTNNTLEDDGVLDHPSGREDDRIDFDETLAGELIWGETNDNGNVGGNIYAYNSANEADMIADSEAQGEYTTLDRGAEQDYNEGIETDRVQESTTINHRYYPRVVSSAHRNNVTTQRSRVNSQVDHGLNGYTGNRVYEHAGNGVYEREWVNGDVEFAPAWDEGSPAENIGERHTRDGRRLREMNGRPRTLLERGQSREPSGPTLNGDYNVNFEASERPTVNESPRRHIRSNLHQERRKLDRLRRSQRLDRAKGHPLGGMTLLELEERQLLDVGIGEMTRLLTHTHRRTHRRVDADLLRRSARLLRRAKMEREARISFAQQRNQQRRLVSAADNKRRLCRRPVSASRDCNGPHPSSVAPKSDRSKCCPRALEDEMVHGRRSKVATASNPRMGLYSGGGMRCRLRHRRPLSAKPALTCGSGWQPGRARARRRSHEHLTQGARCIDGLEDQRARSTRDSVDSEWSYESDLSLNGIIEYDDEEDPFNEDELEQVASSYLRRHHDSLRQASAAEDERLADDGSVYIYREGDLECENERDESGAEQCRFKRTCDQYMQGDYECGSSMGRPQSKDHEDEDDNVCSRHVVCDGSVDWGSGASDLLQDAQSVRIPNRSIGGEQTHGTASIRQVTGTALNGALSKNGGENGERRGSEGHARGIDDLKGEIDEKKHTVDRPASPGVCPHRDTSNTQEDAARCPEHDIYTEEEPETIVPVPHALDGPPERIREEETLSQRPKPSAATCGTHEDAKSACIARRLRQMILDRQASAGRSMRQVFSHFDRRGCGYVNTEEMRDALADLRFSLTHTEAQDFLRMMALDGGDRLSFAEFAVFVSDPRHDELQSEVCRQLSKQLELLGRRFMHLDDVFFARQRRPAPREDSVVDARSPQITSRSDIAATDLKQEQTRGQPREHRIERQEERQVVSASDFLDGLEDLGLRLSATDANRLLVRFDVHGDGHLSVQRFVSMVESSLEWDQALARLSRQEEADEEADACLRARHTSGNPSKNEHLSEDLIEMARYLGIRVSSDSSLLWIAEDALNAPLPEGWAICRSNRDGAYFYENRFTGQSRWDHPLDSHFRRLYLYKRFGEGYEYSEDSAVSGGKGRSFVVRSREFQTTHAINSRVGPEDSSRSFKALQPSRMRPDLRDFTPKKAMENLRTLASSNDYASTPTGTASIETHGPSAHRLDQGRKGRQQWTGSRRTTGPVRPLRRRPVSASALCEGTGDQRESPGTSNVPVAGKRLLSPPRPSGSVMEGGRMTRYATDRVASTKPRRPLSAKAALQRTPRDRQPVNHRKEARENNFDRRRITTRDYSGGYCQSSPQGTWMNTEWEDPLSPKGHGMESRSQRRRDRNLASTEHLRRGIGHSDNHRERTSMTGLNSLSDEGSLDSSTATDDCAWFVERLTDLCRRLSDTETTPASQSPRAIRRRYSRGQEVPGEESPTSRSDRHREHMSLEPLQWDESTGSSGNLPQDGHGDCDGRTKDEEKLRHHVVNLEGRIQSLEARLQDEGRVSDHSRLLSSRCGLGPEATGVSSDRCNWDGGDRGDASGPREEDRSEPTPMSKRGGNTMRREWVSAGKVECGSARPAPSGRSAKHVLFPEGDQRPPRDRVAEVTPGKRHRASGRRKRGGIVLI